MVFVDLLRVTTFCLEQLPDFLKGGLLSTKTGCIVGFMTTNNSTKAPYAVIIRDSKTNEVLFEDTDFSSDARYDWFEQNCISALSTEVVQLVDRSNNSVLIEENGRSSEFFIDFEEHLGDENW